MDLTVRTSHTFLNEDQRWIGPGGLSSVQDARSITLNLALFDLAVAFPNRYLPSGIVLAKVTASGLYGPYSNAATDGRETALGLLLVSEPVDVGAAVTGNHPAAMYWRGEVIQSFLPTGHGLDAAGIVDIQRIAFI